MEEATVASIHAAFRAGTLTTTALVRRCLARIAAYDRNGPELRALITVNPKALEEAARLDAEYATRKGQVGALHGIPIVLKDNFDTQDMPTTAGCVALRQRQPASDAFTVQRMREAGALILAKANLQELARGGLSNSSLGGQVRNPYDLTRTPGGSSGGTGAALAAGFAVLGTGSDTGQSIRSPASANALVGLRPTRGLVSRSGVVPNSFMQDEVGPIARTVEDAARLLDVMAGFDPRDPVTGLGVGKVQGSYLAALDAQALRGARIGVLTGLFGTQARHEEVNRAMEQAMAVMEAQGATLVRIALPELEALLANVSTDRWEARVAFDRYFAAQASGTTLRELAQARVAVPDVQRTMEEELAIADGLADPVYRERVLNRDRLRVLVAATLAQHRLGALLYPLQRVLVAPIGASEQPERNGTLSHGTGFPAIAFPVGFSLPTASAPIGVPIGAELLAGDFEEKRLLSFSYAFEQAARVRKPPSSTPPLE